MFKICAPLILTISECFTSMAVSEFFTYSDQDSVKERLKCSRCMAKPVRIESFLICCLYWMVQFGESDMLPEF